MRIGNLYMFMSLFSYHRNMMHVSRFLSKCLHIFAFHRRDTECEPEGGHVDHVGSRQKSNMREHERIK